MTFFCGCKYEKPVEKEGVLLCKSCELPVDPLSPESLLKLEIAELRAHANTMYLALTVAGNCSGLCKACRSHIGELIGQK